MASKNLSQLPVATTSSASDLFYLVQGGIDKSITFTNLASAIGGGGSPGANLSLSNLTTTSINVDLLPATANTRVLGSGSLPWQTLWVNEILSPGQVDFQLTTGKIYTSSGSYVIDLMNGLLSDNSQAISIDWINRFADGPNGAHQLGWSDAGVSLPSLTATTVPYLNSSNILTSSAVTPTELGYVSGTTSNIQTQLNSVTAHGILTASGTAVLVAGAATISAAAVTPSTIIMLTTQAMGGTIGIQYVANRIPGTGFHINSNSSTDTSTVGYVLIEP